MFPLHHLSFILMKRIRCPKCDESIIFDEKLYEPGRVLVFECTSCHKQFKIRIAAPKKDNEEEPQEEPTYGKVIIIENAFQLKQEIPLHLGDNVFGRYVKGTKANAAIKTVDPSIDTTHCVIQVKLKNGVPVYVLRDGPSGTGTFYMNQILGLKEQVIIEEGAIITIGATTMILRTREEEEDEA